MPDTESDDEPRRLIAPGVVFIDAQSGFIAIGFRRWVSALSFDAMTSPQNSHTTSPARAKVLLPAVLTGGIAAGVLDAASAFHAFGWGMPYGIASGLLGSKAFPAAGGGGAAIWILGLVLHFIIALGVAAVYCLASERLTFLRKHFLVGGVFLGVGEFLVMNLVVLPLSAVPFPIGPFTVAGLRHALLIHIFLIGLPIAVSLWWFARRAAGELRSSARDPERIA